MSFLKPSTSFARFRVADDIPGTFWGEVTDKLREFAFKDIDELPEERSWGWACFEDMLDLVWDQFPPQKGGDYLTFSLRLETRRIPPAVLKKHLGLALKREELQIKQQGKSFVARERKKEIKELVLMQLKKRFLPIPAEFQVVWNITENVLYFASTRSQVLELFEEYFLRSFGLHLDRLTPYGLAEIMLDESGLDKIANLESADFYRI